MKRILTTILTLLFVVSITYGQELAMVRNKKKKVGFIDLSGAFVIEPQFKNAFDFSGKYAAVAEGRKWGYIDTKGKWAIEPQYKLALPFNSGYALVNDADGKAFYVDGKNQKLEVPEADKLYSFNDKGVALIKIGDKVGLINTKGQFVLKPKYDVIKKFDNGYARVREDGKWGIIDTKGKVIIPATYDDITRYSKNGVGAKKGESWGVVKGGKFTALAEAEKIWDFTESSVLAYARKDGKMGFINGQGKWVIEPAYEKARAFNNGLAPVVKDGKWGYINERGEKVIDFKYSDAEIFAKNGLAPVKEKKLWGFIDKTGKLVIPMDYALSAGLSDLFRSKGVEKGFQDNGLARVGYKKKWGFINAKGEVLGQWYKNVDTFVDTSK